MPKEPFTCLTCGTQGECWPSQRRRFCSQKCRSRYVASEDGWKPPVKPKTGVTEPCRVCGTPVYRKQHQIKSGKGITCSRNCANEYLAREAVSCTCERCGKQYRISKSRAGWRKTRWCSKACERDARLKRPLDRMHNGRPARLDHHGYIRIYEPTDPRSDKGGWVFEHRYVVEQSLGRTLSRNEAVHHINGIKHDNRLENLQVMDAIEHARLSGRDWRDSIKQRDDRLAEYEKRFGPLN